MARVRLEEDDDEFGVGAKCMWVAGGAEDPGHGGQWSGRECSGPVVNTWRALHAQDTSTATWGPITAQRVEAPAPLVASMAASGQKYPPEARAAHQSVGPPPLELAVGCWFVSPFTVGRPAGLCAAKTNGFVLYKFEGFLCPTFSFDTFLGVQTSNQCSYGKFPKKT